MYCSMKAQIKATSSTIPLHSSSSGGQTQILLPLSRCLISRWFSNVLWFPLNSSEVLSNHFIDFWLHTIFISSQVFTVPNNNSNRQVTQTNVEIVSTFKKLHIFFVYSRFKFSFKISSNWLTIIYISFSSAILKWC